MEEMKRCLTSKGIRVTLPNACGQKIKRGVKECLEGSGCEAKRYNNIDADSDGDGVGDGHGGGDDGVLP